MYSERGPEQLNFLSILHSRWIFGLLIVVRQCELYENNVQ